ncbi:MAG: hypothetical protein EXQ53_07080 [Acidobacteria bacterium]|nr:hypothetical protein [Acidobacteriota bacterium]
MGMRIAALAMAVIGTVGALMVPARAQQRAAPQDTPADVKALVFDLANSMGMLRALQQEDSIMTLEHWAKGTLTLGQQRFEVPEYRLSMNYAVPGLRVDLTRMGPNGQKQRQIEVVSGTAAWNETERGRNATAAPDRVKERLVHLWTTPMGVVKAARAAGAKATVRMQGGAMILSFPLPAPAADVTVNATVRKDASLAVPDPAALKELVGTYVTSVETTGAVVSQTTYAEYGDWNWDDYQADIMLPRRIVRKSGDTTLELTTINTNTYNPYVIMPVPETLKR